MSSQPASQLQMQWWLHIAFICLICTWMQRQLKFHGPPTPDTWALYSRILWFVLAHQCGGDRNNSNKEQSGNWLEVIKVPHWPQLSKCYSSLYKTKEKETNILRDSIQTFFFTICILPFTANISRADMIHGHCQYCELWVINRLLYILRLEFYSHSQQCRK